MQKKLCPLKVEATNLFNHLRLKHTFEYNQATKEMLVICGDVQSKQMIPQSIVPPFTGCTKCEVRMNEIAGAVAQWNSSALSSCGPMTQNPR